MARLLPATWAPYLLSLLRIAAAALFLVHGTQKLFGMPGARPAVELASLLGLASILETCGGLLLLVGLFTGPVAFLLAGEMAIAHAPRGVWPILNGGEVALLYCLIWMYLSAAGPGPWSLDARLRSAAPDRRSEGRLAA